MAPSTYSTTPHYSTPPSHPSALEYCLDVEKLNLSAIRTVRVLRPLRAINRIPSK